MKYEFKTEEEARKAFNLAFHTYSDYAKNVTKRKWKAPKCEVGKEEFIYSSDDGFFAHFIEENINLVFILDGKILYWAAEMDYALSPEIGREVRYGEHTLIDKYAQLSILRQFESIAFGAVSAYAEDKKDCDLKCSFVFRTYDGE